MRSSVNGRVRDECYHLLAATRPEQGTDLRRQQVPQRWRIHERADDQHEDSEQRR